MRRILPCLVSQWTKVQACFKLAMLRKSHSIKHTVFLFQKGLGQLGQVLTVDSTTRRGACCLHSFSKYGTNFLVYLFNTHCNAQVQSWTLCFAQPTHVLLHPLCISTRGRNLLNVHSEVYSGASVLSTPLLLQSSPMYSSRTALRMGASQTRLHAAT